MHGKEKPKADPFRDPTPDEEDIFRKQLGAAYPTSAISGGHVTAAPPLFADFEMQSLPSQINLENLKTGMGTVESKRISEIEVAAFGKVSGDMNPIHFDDVYASRTAVGERIAHGMLTASYAEALMEKSFGSIASLSSLSLRFESPVKLGADLNTRVVVAEDPNNGGRLRLVLRAYSRGATALSGDATLETQPDDLRDQDTLPLGQQEDTPRTDTTPAPPASFRSMEERWRGGDTTESVTKTITHQDLWAFREVMGSRTLQHVPLTLLGSYLSAIFGTKFPGPGAVYVSQTLNRRAPVDAGDTIVAEVKLVELRVWESDPRNWQATFSCTCLKDGAVVLDGKAVLLVPMHSNESPKKS